jgi:hypothetical protein
MNIKEVLESNKFAWGKFYFTHHFRGPSPAFHLRIIEEADKHNLLGVAAPRESAKAQSLDSLVLTVNGWVKIGDLSVGDRIIGGDGKENYTQQLTPHGCEQGSERILDPGSAILIRK